MAKVTLANAKMLLADIGFSLTKREGEYRLAPRGASPEAAERKAYYSADILDVIATALHSWRGRHNGAPKAEDSHAESQSVSALQYFLRVDVSE